MQSEIDSLNEPPYSNKLFTSLAYYSPRDVWLPKYQFAAPNLDSQITSQIIFFSRLLKSMIKFG